MCGNNKNVSYAKDMYCITVTGSDVNTLDIEWLHSFKGTASSNYKPSTYTPRKFNNLGIDYYISNVKSIEEMPPQEVYNIAVENDDSYLVTYDMIATHNCKHLIALLSNKRWLQQVTSRFVDWLVENLDQVNEYLRLPEDRKLTAPDAEARQRGKQASMNRWADRVERINDIAEEYLQDRKDFIEHNEDEGIIEDIQRWLKDNYTAETGYDYVKATPEEVRAILNYVTKDLDRNINNDTEIEDEVESDN